MGRNSQGIFTGLLLAGAALLSAQAPPTDWPSVVCFLVSIVALECYGYELKNGTRFTPAVPVYLAAAACVPVGGLVPVVLAAGVALARFQKGFLSNLAGYRDLAAALTLTALAQYLVPQKPALAWFVGPALYAVLRYLARPAPAQSTGSEEKRQWFLFHLRVKPLEVGQAFAAPLIVLAYQFSPWAVLAAVPVLATGKLAVESILQKSQEGVVQDMAQRLRGAQEREERVEKKLARAQGDKLALDTFSQLLLKKPDLQTAAQSLLHTAEQVVDFDSGAVFLGDPPEPFIYQAGKSTESRLQGSALTGLREPVVDRAWQEKRPVHQRKAPEESDRLFCEDEVAAALPLAGIGVLYFGRSGTEPFSKEGLDQLTWLADKVKLALRSAYAQEEDSRRRRSIARTVQSLEHRVAWMALLLEGAETLASSLQRSTLVERLVEFVKQAIPHQGGCLSWNTGEQTRWGTPLQPDKELLQRIVAFGGALRLEDLSQTPYRGLAGDASSLLGCALRDGDSVSGVMILVSQDKGGFTQPMADLLMLLNSQAAMALANSGLYQDVVEARRHLEETQAQLVQSSKMTALGQLAAGVAHELNTPLGAISLALEETLRQQKAAGGGSSRLLESAQKAVTQSREIIDRLMAYVRTPLGEFSALDLRDALEQAAGFLSTQLEAQEVALAVDAPEALPVQGELQALVQVFLNLITNAMYAVSALPPKDRRIAVQARRAADALVISVIDEGCGIEPDHLPRIFDPFFTTKPVGKGTGLGLWASHRIVTEHQGRLDVTSTPGKGTTFTVTLPAMKKAE